MSKKQLEHVGRRIRTRHYTTNTLSSMTTHYEATNPNTIRQYEQKRSEYDAHKQIKTEITYRRIIKYISVFLISGIILNFTLAILMGKI